MEEKEIFENVNFDDVKSLLELSEVKKLPRSEPFEKKIEVNSKSEQAQNKQVDEEPEKKVDNHESKKEKSTDILKGESNFFPKPFRRGDIISVTVVKIESSGIMVSAGRKEDHFIPTHGLSLRPISSPGEVVKIGNKIDVLVMRDGDSGSGVVLSKKMADYIKKWRELKSEFEMGEIIQGHAVKTIKGGLLIDIDGITAFLPQSQIGLRKGEITESFVNKMLDFHILEIDQSIKRIIVSRFKVLSELREKEKKLPLVNLKKGEIYDGIVRAVQDFGVFVDIGNRIEGLVRVNELTWGRRRRCLTGVVSLGIVRLIHISQLDTKRVNKVEDIVKIGDRVQAKVIAVDKENKKIKLSRKALLENQ